ncbi:23S rRNA (pseudouridine(1915)-N(3))-methyltransferase RlmH [Bosea sp. CS1GBMeth4]|uniref:23S rRNA (pseudouridine(1915)-N(3))-methyltransferase RlmH n=1 Tax=Bosea sp. CS1GBMeth4 TaxID=1892849 RepID=UPI001644D5B1|nr:23S rRNA (pseudouridine(1915)-N(3))-methyltransferase RlmH [Bosea sp. CS1GBMeth4]
MRLSVIAVGRLKDGPERDLCARYQERAQGLARGLGFSGPEIVEIAESRGRRTEERRRDEARLIGERLPPSGLVIALDERGASLDSDAFASRLATARDAGTPAATLLIGGADGLDAPLRERAAWVLSFGGLTIPHQIVRALVLEQLYRAMTIMAGHPYHRA